VHLVAGLVVSVLAVWGFLALADAVVEQDAITQFDIALADNLHSGATRFGIRLAHLLSDVGGPIAMSALMIAVAIVLWVRRERLLMTTWLVAFIGGSVLDQALKFSFRRTRPTFANPLVVAHGFSFPSGHAMGSLIGFGLLAYLMARMTRRPKLRVAIVVIACSLIVGVGLSRLYLGAHFFSDVVAGYAAGIVWLTACISGAELTSAGRVAEPLTVVVSHASHARRA
jgi:undecaprenyl-diphosphatase